LQQLPGEFTSFDFIPGIPAPFNFGLAILLNDKVSQSPQRDKAACQSPLSLQEQAARTMRL